MFIWMDRLEKSFWKTQHVPPRYTLSGDWHCPIGLNYIPSFAIGYACTWVWWGTSFRPCLIINFRNPFARYHWIIPYCWILLVIWCYRMLHDSTEVPVGFCGKVVSFFDLFQVDKHSSRGRSLGTFAPFEWRNDLGTPWTPLLGPEWGYLWLIYDSSMDVSWVMDVMGVITQKSTLVIIYRWIFHEINNLFEANPIYGNPCIWLRYD